MTRFDEILENMRLKGWKTVDVNPQVGRSVECSPPDVSAYRVLIVERKHPTTDKQEISVILPCRKTYTEGCIITALFDLAEACGLYIHFGPSGVI